MIYEGFLRIARSPLPTLAAVNGAAVGAGMNLALGCDVRMAAARARFDTRFLQIGLHPGGGHTWMQRRIVGPQAAMAAVVFGQVLDGAGGRAGRSRLSLRARRRPARPPPRRSPPAPPRPRGSWRSSPSRRSPTWPTSTTHRDAVDRELEPAAVDGRSSRGSRSGSRRCRPRSPARPRSITARRSPGRAPG